MATKSEKISPFTLAMITMAIIVTLRGLPLLATHGLSSIFFYGFSAIFFLIPVSLIAAEMATAWPEKGGIFLWVSKAFGNRFGFLAAFLQWIPIVIWYPTALSFIAAALSYLISPELAENKYYIISVVLIIYWGATLINFGGLRASGRITTLCVIFGTMLPATIIIISGSVWLLQGHASQITFSVSNLIPDLSNIQNIVFLAGALLLFGGMEISAVHVNEVEDPKKNYPKAVLLSVIVILLVNILGTLGIAIVVPKEDISLVAGVMQAFTYFFEKFQVSFLVPVLGTLIALGAIGQVLSMILGPTKSMHEAAMRGDIPPCFKKVNKHNIPVNILLTQGVIVTIFSSIFLLMPSVSSSFWILSALVIQLYLIMYMFFYASGIKLKYKYPKISRPYEVPGKKVGMWFIASLGFISALFVFIITFWPPLNLPTGSPVFYVGFLLGGIILFTAIPLVIYSLKPKWTKQYR
jgi:glutamate:GABA antiporter